MLRHLRNVSRRTLLHHPRSHTVRIVRRHLLMTCRRALVGLLLLLVLIHLLRLLLCQLLLLCHLLLLHLVMSLHLRFHLRLGLLLLTCDNRLLYHTASHAFLCSGLLAFARRHGTNQTLGLTIITLLPVFTGQAQHRCSSSSSNVHLLSSRQMRRLCGRQRPTRTRWIQVRTGVARVRTAATGRRRPLCLLGPIT